ncbi:MAG: hypothetical protein IPM53_06580 [Anaerolineaceae bacterium]|nr:hypothetical protein [Anaerolineaceae bacterium]
MPQIWNVSPILVRRFGWYVLTIDADLLLEADVMDTPITGLRRWAARWAASKSYQLADHIVTVSTQTRENLVQNWVAAVEPLARVYEATLRGR